MMKRFLCLMACLALVMCSVSAWAEEDYSLTEKLQRQIEFGNGVKGAMIISADGESDWAKMLSALNGTEIQIRGIKDQNSDRFQVYLYAVDGEEQVALTRLYGSEQALYLSSVLLPELVLSYPIPDDMLGSLLPETENVSWYSAAVALMSLPETSRNATFLPVLEPYYAALELWLADYAAEPKVNQQSGGDTVMTVRYEIPAEDVKAQLKALVQMALQDEAMTSALGALMTDEQKFTYLTPGLMYYYEAAIDAMALEGSIVLERDLSTMGESVSTAVQLPMPLSTGWQTLELEQSAEGMNVSLLGETGSISLVMEKATTTALSGAYSGVVRVTPGTDDAQAVAVAFDLSRVTSHSVDDDTREHDVCTWKLSLQPDDAVQGEEGYLTFEPITLEAMTHIHSKSAKRNATTLEVTFRYAQGADSFALAGSVKTASPWVLDDLPTEGAEDVTGMTENYLGEIALQWWSGVQSALSALNPVALPDPATATDVATGTELPTEPTAVPATTTDLTP